MWLNWFFLSLLFIYLFIYYYFWLCWVFVSVRGLSLVAASGGHSSSRCAGLSLSRPLLLRSTGSRRAVSVVVAHGPSCSAACGILTDQGSNPCPLHWQADSQPLRHQGSPKLIFKTQKFRIVSPLGEAEMGCARSMQVIPKVWMVGPQVFVLLLCLWHAYTLLTFFWCIKYLF